MHQEELKNRQQRKGHNELNVHDAIRRTNKKHREKSQSKNLWRKYWDQS